MAAHRSYAEEIRPGGRTAPRRRLRDPAFTTAATAPIDGWLATIVHELWRQVDQNPDRPALRHRTGSSWETISWADYGHAVRRTAAGLVRIGVQPGDRVAVLANNRWEWHVVDLATMAAGATTVPIYQTSSSSGTADVLARSKAKVCVVEDTGQLAKVLLRRHELPALEHVFVMDECEGLDDELVGSFSSLMTSGDTQLGEDLGAVTDRWASLRGDDLATLVFTSGTTGSPKATKLSHANIMANLRNVLSVVPVGADDRFLSFLPLSHIAERTVSDFGQIVAGGETWFASSLASVPDDIRACRPTVFFAVPRVWEKFQEAVLVAIAEQPRPLRSLAARLFADDPPPPGLMARWGRAVARRSLAATLGRRIRRQLGLDRARLVFSGAAPIAPDLLAWFERIGIVIAEVYGQTEDCGVTTVNPPGGVRRGTVGVAPPGVEVRIAEDDEILVRGANVTVGYEGDEVATAELLEPDGWMHTGDLGQLDEDGYLSITGRKKDLIVLSSGKNISPQAIELDLRADPLISQAVVVGDDRPYLVALLTLDPEALSVWATEHTKLAEPEVLVDDPQVLAAVRSAVERTNERHARIEGIKRWKVLPQDLTVAEDELTPTLKVKRQIVLDRTHALIEQLYAG